MQGIGVRRDNKKHAPILGTLVQTDGPMVFELLGHGKENEKMNSTASFEAFVN